MVMSSEDSRLKYVIVAVSIAVPILVAVLILMPTKASVGDWVKLLPHVHASLNSLTAIVMILALVSIKLGHTDAHRYLMTSGIVMGALFLLSYVVYHSSVESVVYGDTNGDGVLSESESLSAGNRGVYLSILLSHIVLSMFTLPLVLMAYYRAIKKEFVRHKKLVRWAYPMWLYVSVTGVVVYYMIRPYYL